MITPKELPADDLERIERELLASEEGISADDYGDHGEDMRDLIAHMKWLREATR